MTLAKICGITRIEDARVISAAGADFLGLNLWPRSKRHVSLEHAAALAAAARAAGPAKIVGLFVDAAPSEIQRSAAQIGLDAIQLHGDETPADAAVIAAATGLEIWKAHAADRVDLTWWEHRHVVLLDTPTPGRGGSGKTFDWAIAKTALADHPIHRVVLAGGLDPDNVTRAIAEVAPWAVDVASGVESAPGIKDLERVAAFLRAVRLAERR